MYTGGGGGNSHTTVAKFQYMPGGHGGGGSARPTAGETSSISGRNANTTADKALCCSQAFIHIFSRLPSAWESYDSCNVRGLDSAQTVATMATTVCIGFRQAEHGGRSCFECI